MKFWKQSLALMVMSLMLGSCQSTPDVVELPSPSAPQSLDSSVLAYTLANKDWCSNHEAASLILLLVDGEDRYQTFDERVRVLESKGLVQPGWQLKENDVVTKGTLAFMVWGAMDNEGGVMLRLLPCRHYAYRETVYKGLITRGSEYEPVTGPEAVAIMGRVSRQMEKKHEVK